MTIKQLKEVDVLVEEMLVQWDVGREDGKQEIVGGRDKVIGLDHVSSLASILSQLNLNGHAILACQRIFM